MWKKQNIENFKTTISSKNYDIPKTTRECGIFLNIWVAFYQMMEDVIVKLNVELLWLKLHSTRRRLFLLAHWTWN